MLENTCNHEESFLNLKYIELEGWDKPTAGICDFKDLDPKAVLFIETIEELCGAPVVMISTGPRREDIIIRE